MDVYGFEVDSVQGFMYVHVVAGMDFVPKGVF